MREDLEKALRDRLAGALARYRQAADGEAEAEFVQSDCRPGRPDGLAAKHGSLRRSNAAQREYRTALREWRDFVFYGKTPLWLLQPRTEEDSNRPLRHDRVDAG